MCAIANRSHDISLQQDSAATEYGFMLAKRDGVKLWKVEDASFLPPRFFTSAAAYTNLNPEEELVIAQDQWHVNFGLQDTALGGEKQYRYSFRADARFKGRIFNGPALATLTLPTDFVPAISNPGMETTDPPAGWVKESTGTGTWTRSTTQKQAGTYSGRILGGSDDPTTVVQKHDFAPFAGKTLTFTCYIYQDTANTGNIGIADGVGTSWSTNNANTGSWVQVSIARAIDAAATQLYLYFRNTNTASAIVYFDTAAITLTTGSTALAGNYIRYIDFNSNLYLARGTSLLKYTGSGNWTYVRGFPATITDLAILGDQLFAAIGSANFMFYSGASDDSIWSEASTANNKAQFFAEIGGTLWYNDGDATIRNITAANGAASAQTTIGLTTTDITGLIQHAGLLYIMKTDQPYERASGGGITAIMPEAVSEVSTTSGKNPLSFKGDLYIQTGTQSLWRWGSATDIETVSPARFAPGESGFGGKILALANDAEFLFAILKNGSDIYFMSMREEIIDGSTDWRWHPIQYTTSAVNHAWVSTVGSNRLWICGNDGDTPTFIYLPENYADPTTDTTYQRNLLGDLYTPWYSGGFIDETKAFYSLTLLSSGLTAARTIGVDYQKLGDAGWTVGWTFAAAASPSKINYFAADTTSKKIRFKITFTSDSATAGPILLGLIVRCALMPTKRKKFTFTVRVADHIKTRMGFSDPNLASVLETALNAYNAETWPVILRVPDNASSTEGATLSYNIKFTGFERIETIDEVSRNPELYISIVATEAKIS